MRIPDNFPGLREMAIAMVDDINGGGGEGAVLLGPEHRERMIVRCMDRLSYMNTPEGFGVAKHLLMIAATGRRFMSQRQGTLEWSVVPYEGFSYPVWSLVERTVSHSGGNIHILAPGHFSLMVRSPYQWREDLIVSFHKSQGDNRPPTAYGFSDRVRFCDEVCYSVDPMLALMHACRYMVK